MVGCKSNQQKAGMAESNAKPTVTVTIPPYKYFVDKIAGDKVDVIGTSKGKGTAGAIKRWNFSRLKESHGTGPVARHAGSLGACSDPSRVFKGKKLAGHLGSERVTIQNLDIVKVDAENNLIAIKGAIPGPRGGIVVLKDSVKNS